MSVEARDENRDFPQPRRLFDLSFVQIFVFRFSSPATVIKSLANPPQENAIHGGYPTGRLSNMNT